MQLVNVLHTIGWVMLQCFLQIINFIFQISFIFHSKLLAYFGPYFFCFFSVFWNFIGEAEDMNKNKKGFFKTTPYYNVQFKTFTLTSSGVAKRELASVVA